MLYGELMCLDAFHYNKEGLTRSYQVFGAIVKADESLFKEITDRARKAGFSVVPRDD